MSMRMAPYQMQVQTLQLHLQQAGKKSERMRPVNHQSG